MNQDNFQQKTIPEQPREENFIKEILKFTIIALAIVIPIRAYIAQPFIVSGASMDPTFKTGEYLIVDQVTYNFHEPRRNDVIVFKYPKDTETFFIKRIIGLPGEKVTADRGKITIINTENPEGFLLEDEYVTENHRTTETFSILLDDDEYFVMGDNRAESSDSRLWGPLEEKFIVGRPLARLLPLSKVSVFPGR